MASASIRDNIASVQERISRAAQRSGRSGVDVLLVAVTKTHDLATIQAACEAGLRHFGENRVEEGKPKIAAAHQCLPGDVVWHMIGHIQSRKTHEVAGVFDWVHSVDRARIARRLSETAVSLGRVLDVLLEVNLSGEETKSGFDLSRWPDDALQQTAFFEEVAQMLTLAGLRWQGLMTMAPFTEEPDTVRPVFRRLRELRSAMQQRFPQAGWPHLSMGMSGDFEAAVEEGATIVRIGTAIFGPRQG
jgi:hypothetical protein